MALWHEKSTVDPDFPFSLYVIEPTEWPLHWHEEIEIVYVLEGSYSIELNHTPYSLRERDILLIGSGDAHWTVPQLQKSRVAVIKFGLPIFGVGLIDDRSKTAIYSLLCQSKKVEPQPGNSVHRKVEKLIQAMIHLNEDREPGSQLLMGAHMYYLVALLLREMPVDHSANDRKKSIKRLSRLEKIFRYIELEYKRDIPLEEAAHTASLSVYYFTRFFKEATGKTFARYLMEYRINRAKWHLTNPRAKVTEVAFETGFNNTTTFNRIFKEMTGMTPTEYKRQSNGSTLTSAPLPLCRGRELYEELAD